MQVGVSNTASTAHDKAAKSPAEDGVTCGRNRRELTGAEKAPSAIVGTATILLVSTPEAAAAACMALTPSELKSMSSSRASPAERRAVSQALNVPESTLAGRENAARIVEDEGRLKRARVAVLCR